ncbi:MAG: HemK2/MTQ2 family protein methyltransferase [Mycobacterium sp.]
MTVTLPDPFHIIETATGVYPPQEDSCLLIDTLERTTVVVGRSVADLCTGSGIVAIAAAELGARSVAAWDISADAVACARRNADRYGVAVDVTWGFFQDALVAGPYDVVLCNPPYVPAAPVSDLLSVGAAGPVGSWDGGEDGRAILDPLCKLAPDLLRDGGTLLFVQSEFSGVDHSLTALGDNGLRAEVVAWQRIPFGPVLVAQADWLERTGKLQLGQRDEELVVIRADKS